MTENITPGESESELCQQWEFPKITLGVLTTTGRKHIKPSNFALPGRRYPIHDRAHGIAALQRVAQYGTPSEQARVRRAVKQRFPKIGV